MSARKAAQQSAADAAEQYQLTVADALKPGGSIRELHDFTGLSTSTAQKWGRAHGWPRRGQRKQWADEQGPARRVGRAAESRSRGPGGPTASWGARPERSTRLPACAPPVRMPPR